MGPRHRPTLATEPCQGRVQARPFSDKLTLPGAKVESSGGGPTTVIIRNVPASYAQLDLITELESLGFAGTFDFVYIPEGTSATSNLGYAVVNFMSYISAEKCMKVIEGYHFQCKQGSCKASASVSSIQGLERNMQYYGKAALNASKKIESRPVVVANLSKLIP